MIWEIECEAVNFDVQTDNLRTARTYSKNNVDGLYAIEIGNGLIKIGGSSNVLFRVKQHLTSCRLYGNGDPGRVGVLFTTEWERSERDLKLRVLDRLSARISEAFLALPPPERARRLQERGKLESTEFIRDTTWSEVTDIVREMGLASLEKNLFHKKKKRSRADSLGMDWELFRKEAME